MFYTYQALFQKEEWSVSCNEKQLHKLMQSEMVASSKNIKVYRSGRKVRILKDGLFKGVIYKPVFYGEALFDSNMLVGYFSRSVIAKYMRTSWYTFLLIGLIVNTILMPVYIWMGQLYSIFVPMVCILLLTFSDKFFKGYSREYDLQVEELKRILRSWLTAEE